MIASSPAQAAAMIGVFRLAMEAGEANSDPADLWPSVFADFSFFGDSASAAFAASGRTAAETVRVAALPEFSPDFEDESIFAPGPGASEAGENSAIKSSRLSTPAFCAGFFPSAS